MLFKSFSLVFCSLGLVFCLGGGGFAERSAAASSDSAKLNAAAQSALPVPAHSPIPQELLDRIRKYWNDQVALFAAENKALPHGPGAGPYTVFLGDSITEGFPLHVHFPGLPLLKRGISGDHIGHATPEGLLQRLDVSVFDCPASRVVLLIGVNDLADYVRVAGKESARESDLVTSRSATLRGYGILLDRLAEGAPGVEVLVTLVYPTRGRYGFLNGEIVAFNRGLLELARGRSLRVLDPGSEVLLDASGELRAEFTVDGLHLNGEGYGALARYYAQVLEHPPIAPGARGAKRTVSP